MKRFHLPLKGRPALLQIKIIGVRPQITNKKMRWQTKGSLMQPYDKKGIDIAGKIGQAIFATASGKVVYAGNGLPGYGNLIIIKHPNNLFSAYAYANRLLVKEGQWVQSGYKIALMGRAPLHQNEAKRVKNNGVLHFEIRRAGKPINPLPLLAKS